MPMSAYLSSGAYGAVSVNRTGLDPADGRVQSPQGSPQGRIEDGGVRKDDVRGGQRRAVVEAHGFAEFEHPDRRRRLSPRLGQCGLWPQLRVELDQPVVDLLNDPPGRGVIGQPGIERPCVDVDADPQSSAGWGRPPGEDAPQGYGEQQEEHTTQVSPDHVVPPSFDDGISGTKM